MKKVTLVVICMVLLGGYCFAEDFSESFFTVQSLLDQRKGLKKNFNEIKLEAVNLTATERQVLFDDFKRSPWLGFGLNMLPGFGIGSFVQGNIGIGFLGLFGDLISVPLVLGGIGMAVSLPLLETFLTLGISRGEATKGIGVGMMTVGLVLFVGSKLITGISAFTYISKQNAKLEDALGVQGLAYHFLPAIDMNDKGLELTLARFRY